MTDNRPVPAADPSGRVSIGMRCSYAVTFFLLNVPVSLLVLSPLFLRSVSEGRAGFVANLLMYVSTVLILNLTYLLFLILLVVIRLPVIVAALAGAISACCLQLVLLADVKLFAVFKFHINGMIINFFMTEGAGDSFDLGLKTMVTFAAVVLAVAAVEFWLARLAFYRGNSLAVVRRLSCWIVPAALLVVLLDKAVYASADLRDRTPVMMDSRFFPFYVPVTINDFASKLGYSPPKEARVRLDDPDGSLLYPARPLTFRKDGPRPNIVVVLIDGVRHDVLTPEIMPRMTEFASDCVEFKNHFSGGNSTRFGIFSMVYGLHGNLWHPFLNARRGPALVDSLKAMNYDFRIYSSTLLTFPEFRKTAFVAIPDSIHDNYPQASFDDRDAAIVVDFNKFLQNRDTNRPFFAFLYFNSSHAMYPYPPEHEKFKPAADPGYNYMKGVSVEQARLLKNRYLNSIHFLDELSHKVVSGIRSSGQAGNTIVVVLGDHGEEFMENGFFSHNSGFDDYQVRTLCLMSIPGVSPRVSTNLTSHVDIVPTIMEHMGCENQVADYSHGRSLLTGPPAEWVFSADWGSAAIVTPEYRLVMPDMVGGGRILELRRGSDYRLVDDKAIVNRYRPALLEVVKDRARFLK
ncbi:MAG: hypothetical protein C0404_02655 [Verrucomicrobia bacterium]|nr:hypothetical protein [Verrucomicrobiota bacterium]